MECLGLLSQRTLRAPVRPAVSAASWQVKLTPVQAREWRASLVSGGVVRGEWPEVIRWREASQHPGDVFDTVM